MKNANIVHKFGRGRKHAGYNICTIKKYMKKFCSKRARRPKHLKNPNQDYQ